jgi:endo-1,4-beta-D-glucanase Y
MRNAIEKQVSWLAVVGLLAMPLGCGGGGGNRGGFGGDGTGDMTGGKGGASGRGGSGNGSGGSDNGGSGGSSGSGGSEGPGPGGVGGTYTPTGHQFGAHPMKYPAGTIRPSGDQKDIDIAVRAQYHLWKSQYLKADCGGYYVATNGGAGAGAENFITVSEGHGYGMVIAAMMAGADEKAQEIFDGMYTVMAKFPSSVNKDLMAWGINKGCLPVDGGKGDSATDGDLDMAFALLLADKQWGSGGTIKYLDEAKRVIAGIGKSEINPMTKLPLLGDWSTPDEPVFYWITRPSDFMTDHMRAFGKATGTPQWMESVTAIYTLVDYVQKNLSPMTGLIPDFIRETNTPMPKAVPTSFTNDPKYLGEDLKTDFDYNSCRVPWHLGTDYVASGDPAVKARLAKINAFIKAKTNNDPENIVDGYSLAGMPPSGAGANDCFTAGFGVAAIIDAANQDWVDKIYDHLAQAKAEDYYGDTIRLLAMIVISGNWWAP